MPVGVGLFVCDVLGCCVRVHVDVAHAFAYVFVTCGGGVQMCLQ